MSASLVQIVIGVVSAIGALAAAVAAWWAARVAMRIATEDRQATSRREARAEAQDVLDRRLESLLALMTAAEKTTIRDEKEAAVGARQGRPVETRTEIATASGLASNAELRARLLFSREYLPLTRIVVLDGLPFSAGDALAVFAELEESLDADETWWLGLEMNDHDPIELQVVRAEILLTVRRLQGLARRNARSNAANVSPIDGWELSFPENAGPGM